MWLRVAGVSWNLSQQGHMVTNKCPLSHSHLEIGFVLLLIVLCLVFRCVCPPFFFLFTYLEMDIVINH